MSDPRSMVKEEERVRQSGSASIVPVRRPARSEDSLAGFEIFASVNTTLGCELEPSSPESRECLGCELTLDSEKSLVGWCFHFVTSLAKNGRPGGYSPLEQKSGDLDVSSRWVQISLPPAVCES